MDESTLNTAISTGRELAKWTNLTYDGVNIPTANVPDGFKVIIPDPAQSERWLAKPFRKRGTYGFVDVDSFTRYFNEHKTPDARIFACVSPNGIRLTGILNFHGGEPSFNDHQAVLDFRMTPEWQSWLGHAGGEMSQCEFANFLEENSGLFVDPLGADLLELVSNLEGHSNANFRQALKLKSGQVQFAYDEEVEVRGASTSQAGNLVVPSLLTVAIAPFQGMVPYKMVARLRYRVRDRKLWFRYLTNEAHLVIQAVAADVLGQVEKATGIAPFKT